MDHSRPHTSHARVRSTVYDVLLRLQRLDSGEGWEEDAPVEGVAALGVGCEDDEIREAAVVAGDTDIHWLTLDGELVEAPINPSQLDGFVWFWGNGYPELLNEGWDSLLHDVGGIALLDDDDGRRLR